MKMYAEKTGVPGDTISFIYKNHVIQDHETAQQLDMKNGDMIRVCLTTCSHQHCHTDGIQIKVLTNGGQSVDFFIKETASMSKLMRGYANKVNVPLQSLQLFYKDRLVKPEDTPRGLGMRDNDVLQHRVVVPADGSRVHVIVMNCQTGSEYHFSIKKCCSMRKLIKCYCERAGVPGVAVEPLQLLFRETLIQPTHTPQGLGLTDNQVIYHITNLACIEKLIIFAFFLTLVFKQTNVKV